MGNKIFKSDKYQVQKETYKNCDPLQEAEINYSPIYTSKEENIQNVIDDIKSVDAQQDIPIEYFKPKE